MLIEFSVSNFRSIAEEIRFSAVASASAGKQPDITHATGNSLAPDVLTSAVVFGPNASGKSSLVNAADFFRWFVMRSAEGSSQGEEIPVLQNRVSREYREKPTTMELVFSHEGEVFQYGFSLTNERVLEEWLLARTSKRGSKTRDIFARVYDPETENYEWSINEGQLPGEREVWKSSTRDNALFLSTAVQLNSKTLRKPHEWIRSSFHVIKGRQRIGRSYTAQLLQKEQTRSRVMEFIRAIDLPIQGFRIEEKPHEIPDEMRRVLSDKILSQMTEQAKGKTKYRVFTAHHNEDGEVVELELEEESDGTQVMFGLAGPIIEVLENGETLLIDELSNSLHPLLLKGLVSLFHDERQNPKGAQLIFTSHETSIISKDFMHKDQIWFIERPNNQHTKLTPMSDFKVREMGAFQRAYLGGKYGAIPNVRRMQNVGQE